LLLIEDINKNVLEIFGISCHVYHRMQNLLLVNVGLGQRQDLPVLQPKTRHLFTTFKEFN